MASRSSVPLRQKAILIHGCCEEAEFFGEGPSPSNNHWLPWLQKRLVRAGIETQTPEMPTPYKPDYPEWKRVFSGCAADSATTVVAHSCGGGFVLRWLTEERTAVQRLVLVAPWIDPFRTRGAFLDFTPDPAVTSRVTEVHLLYSDNDIVEGVKESVATLSRLFPDSRHHRFADKGHFSLADLGTEAFPELLAVLVQRAPAA